MDTYFFLIFNTAALIVVLLFMGVEYEYVLITIVVLAVLVFTYKYILKEIRKNWLITDGEVMNVEIDEGVCSTSGTFPYYVIIHCKYTVNGKVYRSKEANRTFISEKDAQSYINTLGGIKVKYNPDNLKWTPMSRQKTRLYKV